MAAGEDTPRVGVRVRGRSWPGKDNAKGETGKTQVKSGRHFIVRADANVLVLATAPCWRRGWRQGRLAQGTGGLAMLCLQFFSKFQTISRRLKKKMIKPSNWGIWGLDSHPRF